MSVRQCKFTCVKCGKRCSDRPELMSEDSVLCGDHEIDIVYDDTVKCQYCKKVSKASKTDYQRAAKFFGNIQEYRAKLVDDGIVTKEMMEKPLGNRAIVALAKQRNAATKKVKLG